MKKKQNKNKVILIALALVIALGAVLGFYSQGAIGGTFFNITLKTNPSLEDGLVGHWTFDGKDMLSNVADVSGQGNHGSLNVGVSGNTATTAAPGVVGQALQTDGTDDYVLVSNSYDDVATSFSLWFRADTFTTTGYLMNKYFNTSEAWALRTHSSGKVEIHDDVDSADTRRYITPITTGTWYHIVGVIDGNNNNENFLYLDGELIGSGATSTDDLSSYTGDLYIGQRGNDQAYFDGAIDDVRIYNRALSAEEISRLYDLGATTHINTTLGDASANSPLADGMILHWTLDGKNINLGSTTAEIGDASGNGNTGDMVNFD